MSTSISADMNASNQNIQEIIPVKAFRINCDKLLANIQKCEQMLEDLKCLEHKHFYRDREKVLLG